MACRSSTNTVCLYDCMCNTNIMKLKYHTHSILTQLSDDDCYYYHYYYLSFELRNITYGMEFLARQVCVVCTYVLNASACISISTFNNKQVMA